VCYIGRRGLKIKKGDYVYTPRFCAVKIEEVFESSKEAREAGYTEPTHYDKDPEYSIAGKHIGTNRMIFAAIKR
jgi:hypothetical protein